MPIRLLALSTYTKFRSGYPTVRNVSWFGGLAILCGTVRWNVKVVTTQQKHRKSQDFHRTAMLYIARTPKSGGLAPQDDTSQRTPASDVV